MREPPRLATALLKHLVNNDALAGDLREAAISGKSSWWYWRQVLSEVARAIVRDTARRPASTMVVVTMGVACVWFVLEYVPMIVGFDQRLFETGLNRWFYLTRHGLPQSLKGFPALAIWKSLAFAFATYVVAKIDVRSVSMFVIAIVAANVAQFVDLCITANKYSLAQLVADLLVLYPIAALCGAILGANDRSRVRVSC